MLRACAKLLRPGGRMAFITIRPADGLSSARLEQAAEHGPPEVSVAAAHEAMLEAAGLIDVDTVDLTDEFSRTQQAWVDEWLQNHDALADLLGPEALEERNNDRKAMRFAIDEGLLQRTLYTARLP